MTGINLIFGVLFSLMSHPLHMSYTNIEYVDSLQRWEMSVKLFKDDFGDELLRLYGKELIVNDTLNSDVEYYFNQYLKENFLLQINDEIINLGLEMEHVLKDIGVLTNERNDVERRKQLQVELDMIPTRIQNEELKIDVISQKIVRHENSLKQIEENKKTENTIVIAKEKVQRLVMEETELKGANDWGGDL